MVLPGTITSEEPPVFLYDRSSTATKVYKRGELLGKGAFARVYLLQERINGQKFAVKAFCRELFPSNKRQNFIEEVEREMNLHQRLSAHKNIIKFLQDPQFRLDGAGVGPAEDTEGGLHEARHRHRG